MHFCINDNELQKGTTGLDRGTFFFKNGGIFIVAVQRKFASNENWLLWSDGNPRIIHEQPLHVPKATVWCAVTSERIIGPYFFENASGSAITVTGDTNREMLREYSLPLLGELSIKNLYFQQDCATPPAHSQRNWGNAERGGISRPFNLWIWWPL